MYTGTSKSQARVRASVIWNDIKLILYKLPKVSSILIVESFTILKDTQLVIDSNIMKAIILSDSLSMINNLKMDTTL